MEDSEIIELFWTRSEDAIAQTQNKYGAYCRKIAMNILHDSDDAEECLNDTLFKAWNAIPPNRPQRLSAFLGRITRNLSLDRYERSVAAKRGGGQIELALEELQDCLPSAENAAQAVEDTAVKDALDRFLESMKPEKRRIFMRRYWYLSSVKDIAEDLGISESKVKMTLLRAREQLKKLLEKEGIDI